MLIEKVEKILENRGFEHKRYRGCFDITARKRKEILLIKVLDNIDSLQESQARNLRVLSKNLGALACLVGTHTRYELLEDNIVYERFGVPAFTTETFENILDNESPHIYRAKGGLFTEIEPFSLRKARKKSGLTQEELGQKVGVTKKSIYEHESRKMKAIKEVVDTLEKILKADLSVPFNLKIEVSNIGSSPKTPFEKSVGAQLQKKGFKIDFVYQTPFNIIAKEDILILNEAEENERKIKRNLPNLVEFSKISEKPILLLTKDKQEYELPTISKNDLKELSAKDLKKIIKKW
jgi:putative transcriptional regulator